MGEPLSARKRNTCAISSSLESSARTPSRMVTAVTGSLLSATAPIAAASLRPTQIMGEHDDDERRKV